jgi:alcohol dehydrogenase class IV
MSGGRVTFSFPTRIRFGAGAVNELADELANMDIRRPLIVTDAGLLSTPAFSSLRAALRSIGEEGAGWFLFSDVDPNPVESNVRAAATAFREAGADGVIAIGGGSALDVGKAARLLVKRPGFDLSRFYDEPADWADLAPLVAIPTTAGTGSEVGRSSVITVGEPPRRRKALLFHAQLLARSAILDPELTRSLSPKLTAATGADALTHCIESFTCPEFHPMCDGIALEGIRLIIDALPRAFRDGNDIDARGKMLIAAAMGAVAFQKDLGVVHSLAHPLSTLCGMHHGLANALCLIAGMSFCAARRPGIYRRVGLGCGLDVMSDSDDVADRRTIDLLANFLAELGLAAKLHEHGVRADQLDALVEQAFDDPCHKTNVVPVTEADLRKLYLDVL